MTYMHIPARTIIFDYGEVSEQMSSQIEVIESRNTDLKETDRKSNLIITELFDTELIGEGCLESYAWSLEKHCKKASSFEPVFAVPYSGRIYGQLVKCPEITKFHKLCGNNEDFNYEYNGGPFFDFQMNTHKNSYMMITSKPKSTFISAENNQQQ